MVVVCGWVDKKKKRGKEKEQEKRTLHKLHGG